MEIEEGCQAFLRSVSVKETNVLVWKPTYTIEPCCWNAVRIPWASEYLKFFALRKIKEMLFMSNI